MGWKKLALVGAALGLAGAWWSEVKQVRGVQEQVRQALGNPDLASFEDVVFFPQTGAGCGVVKARDKAGASAGFVSFVALADGAVHFGPSEDLSPEEMNTPANAQAIDTLVARTRQSCPGY